MSSESQLEIKRHNYKVSMLVNGQQISSMTHILKIILNILQTKKKVSSVIVIYQNMTPMPHIKMIPNTKRKGRGRWRG